MLIHGQVNAARPMEAVSYTRLDNPDDLFGLDEHHDEPVALPHHAHQLLDDEIDEFDEDVPLLRTHSTIPEVPKRPATPRTPPPAYYDLSGTSDSFRLPETKKDAAAISKVAQQGKRSFVDRLFGRNKSPKVEVNDAVFKRDIQGRLTSVSEELNEVDPLGFQDLDASLKKKLNTLNLKCTSFKTKLKELLRTKESLTPKQRKQMQELITKIEEIKNQMREAVDSFANSLEGKAGEKKLAKLAKNQTVVDRVIKNGNVSAMGLLLKNGADVTEGELDLALSNQRYKLFDLLYQFKGGEGVEPSPRTVENLFDVSMKNGDVAGIRLTANLLGDAQVERSMTDIQEQIEAVQKEIREAKGTRGTRVNPVLRISESDKSVNARIKMDTQLIATLGERVVKLNKILGLLGDRAAFLRGVKAVNDVVAGDRLALNFDHLPSEIEEGLTEAQVRELKDIYVAGLQKALEGFKTLSLASDVNVVKLRQQIKRVEGALKVAGVRVVGSGEALPVRSASAPLAKNWVYVAQAREAAQKVIEGTGEPLDFDDLPADMTRGLDVEDLAELRDVYVADLEYAQRLAAPAFGNAAQAQRIKKALDAARLYDPTSLR